MAVDGVPSFTSAAPAETAMGAVVRQVGVPVASAAADGMSK